MGGGSGLSVLMSFVGVGSSTDPCAGAQGIASADDDVDTVSTTRAVGEHVGTHADPGARTDTLTDAGGGGGPPSSVPRQREWVHVRDGVPAHGVSPGATGALPSTGAESLAIARILRRGMELTKDAEERVMIY